MDTWLDADRKVFHFINDTLSANWLNDIMIFIRNPKTWIPVYIMLLAFFIWKTKPFLFKIIVLTIFTLLITDFTSSFVFKPFIGRLRPCYDTSLNFTVHHVIDCGGKFSMPSNHAFNHFGLSTFWFLVIKNTTNQRWYWLWFWAFLIGFAQVYVGVHFPGDIIAGALFGILTGSFTYYIFTRWATKIKWEKKIQDSPII
jgi:undecaprenyl-diphosphatase